MLCAICGKVARKSKKKYGLCCHKDVEAALANAKRGGAAQLKAFEEARGDDDQFRELVLQFQKASPSNGPGAPRKQFDFCHWIRKQTKKDAVQDGSYGEYYHKSEFIQWLQQNKKLDLMEAWKTRLPQIAPEHLQPNPAPPPPGKCAASRNALALSSFSVCLAPTETIEIVCAMALWKGRCLVVP